MPLGFLVGGALKAVGFFLRGFWNAGAHALGNGIAAGTAATMGLESGTKALAEANAKKAGGEPGKPAKPETARGSGALPTGQGPSPEMVRAVFAQMMNPQPAAAA